jgi:hypothetical protein
MSNELRALLQNAATVPGSEPDLARAARRGLAMRGRRRGAAALAVLVILAAGAASVNTLAGRDTRPSPVDKVVDPATVCRLGSTAADDIPSWAKSANPPSGVPHLMSAEGNVIAFVFPRPLRSGYENDQANKVLFVVREPRRNRPLAVSGSLVGGDATATEPLMAPNSSPGEIYPSDVDVPSPGCWHFVLRWNGHRATINLAYRDALGTFACVTPAPSMGQAIDALVRDGQSRVDHVRVVDAHDTRYENLFFVSADVRARGTLSGTGTWAANVVDFGPADFPGWAREHSYYSVVPVNDLAKRISAGHGALRSPGMTPAASFSQSCVRSPRSA